MTDNAWATADLCDDQPDVMQIVHLPFQDYGGVPKFCGSVATLQVQEDFRPVLAALEQPGEGRVLVVDAGGSLRHAVLGERLLNIAARNGWAGVVVHGAVRDTHLTRSVPIGLRALGAIPQRGESGVPAQVGLPLTFAGVTVMPDDWLWADADGIVVRHLPEQNSSMRTAGPRPRVP